MTEPDRAFGVVERTIRRRTFGTLSTLTRRGSPHATGVVYAVSPPSQPLMLYVTTRTTTVKVANIPDRTRRSVRYPRTPSWHPAIPARRLSIPSRRNDCGC